MDDITDILKRVRKLEIRTRKLVRESFSGEYLSSFKGQGLDFDDFREYQAGDEPRFIDWNVTARTGVPHLRQFHEEREMNVLLVVDVSQSMDYGSRHISKRRLAAEVAALIAFSALRNGDKVGLCLFADQPIKFMAPRKGRVQGLRILKEILSAEAPRQAPTSMPAVSQFLMNQLKRQSLVFMISDFLSDDFEKPLGVLSRKHDLVAIHTLDPAERELPDAGRITLRDPETGWLADVNSSNANLRMAFQKLTQRQREGLRGLMARLQVDYALLSTVGDYLPDLHKLFKSRGRRQFPS